MDDIFFSGSKIAWLLISPDSVLVILLLVTLLLMYLDHRVYARRLLTIIVCAVLLLSILPVGSWLLYPLEARFEHNPELPDEVAGIIVLGGAVLPKKSVAWQQLEMNHYGERLLGFIELARKFPEARLVFTGGDASQGGGGVTEASIVGSHAAILGIGSRQIELETRARNTAENARYTHRLVNPTANSNWILVTTAFHMPRAIGAFCNYGWSLIPYPVDHQTDPNNLVDIDFSLTGHAVQFQQAAHEWIGLLAYYLTGKIPEILPSTC